MHPRVRWEANDEVEGVNVTPFPAASRPDLGDLSLAAVRRLDHHRGLLAASAFHWANVGTRAAVSFDGILEGVILVINLSSGCAPVPWVFDRNIGFASIDTGQKDLHLWAEATAEGAFAWPLTLEI